MKAAKILIVDDDRDMTSSLKAVLEGKRFRVITASDRQQGMDALKSQSPDLVILDVMMDTWLDGFEMAREIKNDARLGHVPILMLTGVKDKSGIDFKSSAGDPAWLPVDAFLDKPARGDVLVAEVERLLAGT